MWHHCIIPRADPWTLILCSHLRSRAFRRPRNFPRSRTRKCSSPHWRHEPIKGAGDFRFDRPRSARPPPRSFFAVASVLGNCNRLAPRQTGGHFQGVGRNSSTAEVRCAAAKWSGEVGWTEAQFNSTVVHFLGLCARYLTLRVYQIIETAWEFWPRDGLSRRRSRVRAPSLPP
jgi:hypothetical protein